MKKLTLACTAVIAALLLLPAQAFAASATVYVSPANSSVTKGGAVVVSLRVSSGSPMNAVEARLNFDGTKLQYAGISYGDSPFDIGVSPSVTGSSVKVSRASTSGSHTGDKLVASVTLSAVASGTAALSVSQAVVADSGVGFSSVSTGSGSVTVNEPAAAPPSSGGSSGTASGGSAPKKSTTPSPITSATPATDAPAQDTTGPTAKNPPKTSSETGTISVTFETDEPSTVQVAYGVGEARDKQFAVATSASKHNFKLTPLVAGTVYGIEITLSDQLGNKTTLTPLSVRTKGVTYAVKLVDKAGKALANHPVELHSDPLKARTNADGIVSFSDVTPGEHTLVLTIDGVTLRQPVRVGAPAKNAQAVSNPSSVTLPFQLAVTQPTNQILVWPLLLGAAFAGSLVTALLIGWRPKVLLERVRHITHSPHKKDKHADDPDHF
jgi:hypothetical protein